MALAAAGLAGCNPDATYTVVYIVRHAEVDYSQDPDDPPLTGVGRARARALRARFDGTNLAAIYQTEKIRTQQTAAPVAEAKGLEPIQRPDGENQELVDHVLNNFSGSAVLIVNHSHNILDVISRFDADPPLANYPPEFDKLFVLIHTELDGTTSAGAFVAEYGAPSPSL